jgi:hypothetical protein
MKLTRTFISSSSPCSKGSGVNSASGGRIFPHFGSANGGDTGENSEMCAGTRVSVFSNRVSGVGNETIDDGDAIVHHPTVQQARMHPKPASDTAVADTFSIAIFVLGQRHCIHHHSGNYSTKLRRH